MKPHSIIPLVLMSLMSFPGWGLTMDDLVVREGLYYEKFTNVPFTGEIDEGSERGHFEKGQRDGEWIGYHPNGQLRYQGTWINGRQDGHWKSYFEDGRKGSIGRFENGKKDGYWQVYTLGGDFSSKYSGTFKNGLKVSD